MRDAAPGFSGSKASQIEDLTDFIAEPVPVVICNVSGSTIVGFGVAVIASERAIRCELSSQRMNEFTQR